MPIREIIESPHEQGEDEVITYRLTTTPWGSNPTGVEVAVYELDGIVKTDVTDEVMPTNDPQVGVGTDIITLSPLLGLTAGNRYRVEVKFTCSGNVFEAFCIVNGTV